MDVKTYTADTMLAALQLVQNDLGPDAIVVSAREMPVGPIWNAWSKTGVEIVAMAGGTQTRTSPEATPNPGRDAGEGIDSTEESRPDIEWVGPAGSKQIPVLDKNARWSPRFLTREEMEAANRVLYPQSSPAADRPRETSKPVPVQKATGLESGAAAIKVEIPATLKAIQHCLSAQGVQSDFLNRAIQLAGVTFSPAVMADERMCKSQFSQLLEAELVPPAGSAMRLKEPVICLVGPSGSGKTATLAKLAMFYGHNLDKKVVWVSCDTLRTGAIAEAKAYTSALGLPLEVVYTPEELKNVLAKGANNDLFLVDTPGYNPYKEAHMVELGGLLTAIPGRYTYLVAPAQTKESDLSQTAAALGIFGLNGLIFTKMDETHSYGNVFNFSRSSRLPIQFFTYGKEASGALQAGDTSRLVAALFGKCWI